jgi:hypothetical protein
MSENQTKAEQALEHCIRLHDQLVQDGIYHAPEGHTWRISPEPFWLTSEEYAFLKELGHHLLAFYSALNHLYLESVKGRQPDWVSRYLDQGKPDSVIQYGRMNRFKPDLPGIIRPDLIPTEEGFIATELDAVPGGIGLTGNLSARYASLGFPVAGGAEGMIQGFARMIRAVIEQSRLNSLAIIVSEESRSYRPEMRWLGARLNERGMPTVVISPDEIQLTEEGLQVLSSGRAIPVEVVYRFFELFDLPNIPKAELILYSVKKEKVMITPPIKAYLEEKMAFALFHHPVLQSFWREALGVATVSLLKGLFPQTWVVDPRPVPPHAVIPDLIFRDRPLTDWRELASATQKERRFVLKPSGFSELAWGSHGVLVGHDLPESEWSQALEKAMGSFESKPYILQPFHKGRKYTVSYYDEAERDIKTMPGRTRLSPYYFVHDGKAELGGILATICPLNKKLIHGMTEAVMVPCAVKNNMEE